MISSLSKELVYLLEVSFIQFAARGNKTQRIRRYHQILTYKIRCTGIYPKNFQRKTDGMQQRAKTNWPKIKLQNFFLTMCVAQVIVQVRTTA